MMQANVQRVRNMRMYALLMVAAGTIAISTQPTTSNQSDANANSKQHIAYVRAAIERCRDPGLCIGGYVRWKEKAPRYQVYDYGVSRIGFKDDDNQYVISLERLFGMLSADGEYKLLAVEDVITTSPEQRKEWLKALVEYGENFMIR